MKKDKIENRFWLIARIVVPEKDWIEFVLGIYYSKNVHIRFPDYCREILNRLNNEK